MSAVWARCTGRCERAGAAIGGQSDGRQGDRRCRQHAGPDEGGALGGTITGAGTLQLDGATAYTLAAGTTLPIGTVAVDAGATLSGAGIFPER